jgi:hypothetical protein
MKKLLIQKNKRGQIFTLIAISLVVLMFLSIQIYSHLREKEMIKNRIKSMDSFMTSIEKNLERQIYISGFRIIFLAIDQISTKGTYITNLDTFINESFFNGTVGGVPQNLMIGATRDNLTSSINEKAIKINVNVSMNNTFISITQDDPWSIKITMFSDFILEDVQGLARWEKRQNITTYVPIVGFQDPFYLVNSNGKMGSPKLSGKINKTIYDGNYNVSGDISNLSDHFEEGYYTNNSDAPSFLKRLKGNFSSDPNGIESFVDTDILVSLIDEGGQQLNYWDPTGTKSVVDYIYFNTGSSVAGNSIVGMPSRFKIDSARKIRYQLG